MELEYIRSTFKGDILIVDDEIDNSTTDIYKIKQYLEEHAFHIVSKKGFPSKDEISTYKLSMVICDWHFIGQNDQTNADFVISFINLIQSFMFVPVFICSSYDKTVIEDFLLDKEKGCYNYKNNDASSIFIVKKEDILGDKLIDFLESWLNKNPSIKLLKEWEEVIEIAKNNMFNALYKESEFWPCILSKNFEDDGVNVGNAMGDFLTKNLLSRISDYSFSKIPDIPTGYNINIQKVLDGERCLYYSDKVITSRTQFYTGDILEKEGANFIVIKRQCDLNRNGNNNLFVLRMNELNTISKAPIELSEDKNSLSIFEQSFQLNNGNVKARRVNKELSRAFQKTKAFYKGKILEQNNEVIIPCICGKKVVSIDLRELSLIQLSCKDEDADKPLDYGRPAKLLEPYISIVIEKFAAYTSSKGSMRTPKELFSNEFIISEDE